MFSNQAESAGVPVLVGQLTPGRADGSLRRRRHELRPEIGRSRTGSVTIMVFLPVVYDPAGTTTSTKGLYQTLGNQFLMFEVRR
jgi:hypothetical protein